MTTFISVGNATQPFARLIEGALKIAPKLPQPVVFQHGNSLFFQHEKYAAIAFVEMGEFARMVSKAEILIMHAGAGSIIHAIQAGKIPVVMPRRAECGEHVDDHQVEFARALAKAGVVVMAEGPEDLIEAVEEVMSRQCLPRHLNAAPVMVSLINEVLKKCAKDSSER